MEETEGAALARLLGDTNRAEFARKHKIKGGGSMISQHVSGHRPISLEAAIAYAGAFGLPLDAVSPSNAARARAALGVISAPVAPQIPQLDAALPVFLDALASLPPARWVSVRAQLEQVAGRPDMRDDVLGELQHLLVAHSKRQAPAA